MYIEGDVKNPGFFTSFETGIYLLNASDPSVDFS